MPTATKFGIDMVMFMDWLALFRTNVAHTFGSDDGISASYRIE
jgi:hypothetical protein